MIDTEIEALDEVNIATVQIADDDSEEEDSVDVEISLPKVPMDDVTKALDSLKLFLSQNDLLDECPRDLNRFERSIWRHRMSSLTKERISTRYIVSFFEK